MTQSTFDQDWITMKTQNRITHPWLACILLSISGMVAVHAQAPDERPYGSLALVGDAEFGSLHGIDATNVLQSAFEEVRALFEANLEVSITLVYTDVLSANPWSISTDSNGEVSVTALLTAFREYRQTVPEISNTTAAVLFSGHDFEGGIASYTFIGGGGTSSGASIVEGSWSLAEHRFLLARGLGGQFGYRHDGTVWTWPSVNHPDPPPCDPALESATGYIMSASTQFPNPSFMFSPCSQAAISNFIQYAAANPGYLGVGYTLLPEAITNMLTSGSTVVVQMPGFTQRVYQVQQAGSPTGSFAPAYTITNTAQTSLEFILPEQAAGVIRIEKSYP